MGNFPPSKLFCPPINLTCPLPKIAHPVNFLAHRKKNRHCDYENRHFLFINPKLETQHSSTRQNRKYLRAVQKLVNIKVSFTLILYKPMVALNLRATFFKVFRAKLSCLCFGRSKLDPVHLRFFAN